MMRAVQFERHGGPEVLQVVDVPRPTAGPGEIVVRNRFAGVNYIDTYYRSGVYESPLPGTLGEEGVGEVVAIGEGVTEPRAGDTVAYLSKQCTYAEYSTTLAARAVAIDPAAVPLETAAAMLLQGLTAHTLVTRAYAVQPGDWVLVQAGAGGTGRLLV
ncbi:hypothetical protein H4R19_000433 [Coemansia spiralis]|nr:hypothetical protein H4R19_000433 [Coemansia spiralis]